MSRVAADIGLPDTEIAQFEKILADPQRQLGTGLNNQALLPNNESKSRDFYRHLVDKEGTSTVPKKAFSTSTGSLTNSVLYSQYYNELVEAYDGARYNSPEFENYIIESFLRRKEK